jgi:hypothetical protein
LPRSKWSTATRLGTAAPRAIETAPEDSVATNLDLGVVKQ